MQFTRNQLMIVGGIALAIVLFIGIFVFLIPALQKGNADEPAKSISLTMWGIEDPLNFSSVIDAYRVAHPKVNINYTQIPEEQYEKTLLDAMATGQAPDIYMIHRSWATRYDNKLSSALGDQITPAQVTTLFPSVVGRDFVRNGYVSALPLSIDSLALLYNRDLFDKKGVAVTPQTWGDVKTLIPYFTEFTPSKQLKKSAIALGGTVNSIPDAPDILSLFMLQFGAKDLETASQRVSFDENAGKAADYYTQFATPNSSNYTWNDAFANASDAFGSGDAAMSLNYSREIPQITLKNPYLNFGILPIPQDDPADPVNYADYWGLAVSTQTPNYHFAWKFIIAAATDPTLASLYMTDSGNPPALRTLINSSLQDPRLGVFAKQALTARALYQFDITSYRAALSRTIQYILDGQFKTGDALDKAAVEINKSF